MTGPTASGLVPDHAPSIECVEIREALSAPSRGLTEWALVHAHVARCPDCQKQRESLQLAVSPQRVEAFSGVRLIEGARALVTWTTGHVPMLAGSIATSVARAWVPIARASDLVMALRSPLATVGRGAAHGARETTGAGATWALGAMSRLGGLASIPLIASSRAGVRLIESAGTTLTRVGRRMPLLIAPSARAARHVIGRGRLGITRVPDAIIRLRSPLTVAVRRTTHAASRAGGDGVARALGLLDRLGVLASGLARSAAGAIGDHPRAYAAIAGLAVLVPSLLFLWSRQGPDDLVPRFSDRERISRETAVPAARIRDEPAVSVPFVVTSPPRPGTARPAPVAAAPPDTPPVTVSHTQAEVPVPVRRRAPAAAPPPSADAVQNADASDPAAAIDWLLQGGRNRRQTENP